jgi:muramidase (phage lysozyme)
MSPNLKAFLDTIAYSEIGPALLAASDNGYNVVVGSTPQHPILFSNYAAHPRLHSMAQNSDAAGRYQFMGRYWPAYQQQLGLPDFGHDSQDRWAVQLIKECHALEDIEAGHVAIAIGKCSSRWASFPGAGYGQHENHLQDLCAAYQRAGGQTA